MQECRCCLCGTLITAHSARVHLEWDRHAHVPCVSSHELLTTINHILDTLGTLGSELPAGPGVALEDKIRALAASYRLMLGPASDRDELQQFPDAVS